MIPPIDTLSLMEGLAFLQVAADGVYLQGDDEAEDEQVTACSFRRNRRRERWDREEA